MTGIARVYEGLNDMDNAVKFYKEVLKNDSTHIEAISCIATHHFYSDQPEVALKFFRRLLQMGVYNTEIYNNIGLCCFYAQQYDMALSCFERALGLADEENVADTWYNISHVAVGIGDLTLAYQCLRMVLVNNNDHPEAFNNLGVFELRKGHIDQARSFFQSAIKLADHMYEGHFNLAHLSDKVGDVQTSFNSVLKSNELYAEHAEGIELINNLRKHLTSI